MNRLFKNFEEVLSRDSAEAQLILSLDPERLPRHIAVIMDGNGRWARQRHLPRVEGHRAGIQAVKSTIETCARLTIPVLTLYAFSAENWKRPAAEVRMLMDLLKEYLRKELATIQESNICFRAIGRIEELPEPVQRELQYVEEESRGNSGMKLVIALNYSARLEIVDAVNRLLRQAANRQISEADIESELYTKGLPSPDLLIRTSGEMRISNFLLWQIAYAEIYVTEVYWPDFRSLHLLQAIEDFQRRERRYGGIESMSFQNIR
ncbi:MAG: isoprenyl transferase [Acidobacteriota bacterium]